MSDFNLANLQNTMKNGLYDLGVQPLQFQSTFNGGMGGSNPSSDFLGGAFGENGWAGNALNAIMSIGQLLQGNQFMGMQKRNNAAQLDLLKTNLFNQAQTTNEAMYSRQLARNALNPNLHASADEHMKRWGVSGTVGNATAGG